MTGAWDEELINDLFWPVDAHQILQIPLTSGREDVVAWHHNRNGFFSVRSAYHCQWIHKFGENRVNEQASVVGEEEVWAKLWKLNVPAKIKNFGWRVLHGLLPCRTQGPVQLVMMPVKILSTYCSCVSEQRRYGR